MSVLVLELNWKDELDVVCTYEELTHITWVKASKFQDKHTISPQYNLYFLFHTAALFVSA